MPEDTTSGGDPPELNLDDLLGDEDGEPEEDLPPGIDTYVEAHEKVLERQEQGLALEAPPPPENPRKSKETEYEVPPPHTLSIEADRVPEDGVELSLDPLTWRGVPEPKIPRFEPLKLALVLNLDALPALAVDHIQQQVAELANQYVERLNGHRQLCQGIAQLTLQKAGFRAQLRRDKTRMEDERKKLFLQVSALTDPHDKSGKKKLYSNDQQRSAAVEVKIQENAELRSISERIENAELDVDGFGAKIGAFEVERKALTDEITALRDALNHFVETGVIASAQLERVGFDL